MLTMLLVTLLFFILLTVRVEVIHNAIVKRTEEVFASNYWYMYIVDVGDTYAKRVLDFRKWTYRDFFPDEVPK